ncbi:disulfide bond formation protein [Leuconostoc mesenteroides subsp. dextranicum]|jgi:molecular chaperone Hsp33|uniref:Hsp33 family molecular chaperone HslO n=1 Tax=Leuconostoc TaxID=1243 RepID=UPI0006826C24|nr:MULTISPECIES: Hsp33 family molecular chaperone HslO [Leuconostoc]KMY82309.1 disulfide bond formation protein [Leuconostoc mesenteroides subsp. dextranicum]MBZ1502171.1 Hsp33 family molecular chaperone HslO [Leuconostoc mesenteroides]MBZ1505740.1 Hsp33 family molecular chaperone HslO [Leuconostoc mesenteroides]MCH3952683.1 Hsp33 family molecular chaperone HslO [Leuconostoc mesenteroides]MCH3979288.1 Hsp33 family molecular chaperone HslO [Leuconostoc mesenteroides]
MADQFIKAITKNKYFRTFAVNGTNLVHQAAQIHETSRIAAVVLGRSLLATTLAAQAVLKGEETLSTKINGRGPIGNVVVESDAKGSVRGYVTNPNLETLINETGQLDVAKAVGKNGFLQVTKFAPYSDPYIGQSQLVSGEIGDDFTYYLAQSEQTPSVIGVSVYMNSDDTVAGAGGFLVQALPDATDEAIDQLEVALKNMKPLSEMIQERYTPLEVLEEIFGKGEVEILQTAGIGLAAEPSKDAYAKMLLTLPASEIQAMIKEDHGAEIVGKFSGKRYFFTEEQLSEILKQIEKNNE